jgi:hypothetical protein
MAGDVDTKPSGAHPRHAFYCCSDDVYIPRAIAALKSIQRFCPDCDYFVVLNRGQTSAENLKQIESQGLEILHLVLDDDYQVGARRWKPIMFWIFKVPELLADRGYRTSCAIDGDVFGVRPMDLSWLDGVEGVAYVRNPPRWKSGKKFLRKNWRYFKRNFGMRWRDARKPNTNTGVIWF